jgi:hypothetical protein
MRAVVMIVADVVSAGSLLDMVSGNHDFCLLFVFRCVQHSQ